MSDNNSTVSRGKGIGFMQLYSRGDFRNEFARVRGSMIDSKAEDTLDPDINSQPVGRFSTESKDEPRRESYDNIAPQ